MRKSEYFIRLKLNINNEEIYSLETRTQNNVLTHEEIFNLIERLWLAVTGEKLQDEILERMDHEELRRMVKEE